MVNRIVLYVPAGIRYDERVENGMEDDTMNAFHLDPKDVPQVFLGKFGYTGRKYSVKPAETVYLGNGYWDGGSRSSYIGMDIATGFSVAAHAALKNPPWFGGIAEKDRQVTLQPGRCVLEHAIFCGKDMGITIYLHPADHAMMMAALPAKAELSLHEQIVLDLTCGLKAFARLERAQYIGLTKAEYEDAKAKLTVRKLLNKAGAVTTEGRNARPSGFKGEWEWRKILQEDRQAQTV